MPDVDTLLHALDLLTTPAEAPLPEGIDQETREVIEQSRGWTGGPNVVGAGVAAKITEGKILEEEVSFKVYVDKKLPLSSLDPSNRVPPTASLPGLAEFSTDVEAIGEQNLETLSSLVRPIQPGYSIGQLAIKSGTLGCIVAKRDAPDVPLLLSNSHILARYGLAPAGSQIVQPGPDDGGGEAEIVGDLLESVIFDFNPGFNNLCDAAVATFRNLSDVTSSIYLIGVPTETAVPLKEGQEVQKSGRTTGHTTGRIKDLHYRTFMSYPKPTGGYGSAGFRDQVLCERYTAQGDSGALVCDVSGNAVGLHWCGSTSTSVFSPISFVFQSLDLVLWSPA